MVFWDQKSGFCFNNMKVHRLQSSAIILMMMSSHIASSGSDSSICATSSFDGNISCPALNQDYPPTFVLYKSGQDGSWEAKVDDNEDFVKHLDHTKKVVFIIHGFLYGCDEDFVKTTKAAYLMWKPDVQVVTVCWPAAFPCLEKKIGYLSWLSFPLSNAAVPCVGEAVAEFLEKLHQDHGVPWENMSIVSHSLGSQVAGAAGNKLNGKLKQLIALDPARDFWQITDGYLNKGSADQVMVLHTSFTMGITKPTGTVDFYANTGGLQPGCIVPSCSHYRCVDLFIESLEDEGAFEATECETHVAYTLGLCNEHPKTNFSSNTKATGVYYFRTGSEKPYSKL